MKPTNPLVGPSPRETVQNVTEALSAVMGLLAPVHSDLFRLMAPIIAALEYADRQK